MKMVCIDDSPSAPKLDEIIWAPNGSPSKGEVVTVTREINYGPDIRASKVPGFALKEYPLFNREAGLEWAWRRERFVPLEYYKAEFEQTEKATA